MGIAPPGSYGTIAVKVDTADLKYAKDPAAFPPDKAALWKHPLETDGWYLEHCNIRSECTKMAEVLGGALAGRKLEEWEIASLRAWFANHNEHIEGHHHHEDDLFTPFMQTRIKLPEKLTTDHVALVSLLKAVMAIVEGPLVTTAALATAFAKYSKLLFAHLKEEEEIALPLLRAYFTPEEVAPKTQEILSQLPPHMLGGFFYHLDGQGGSKKAINQFMAQEGIPFFVYYVRRRTPRDALGGSSLTACACARRAADCIRADASEVLRRDAGPRRGAARGEAAAAAEEGVPVLLSARARAPLYVRIS